LQRAQIRIGILGGGQLARMIIEAGYKYNFEFHILTREPSSPAGLVTKYETAADWNDKDVIKNFAKECDVLTLENEFISERVIDVIEMLGVKLYPAPAAIKLIQDKLIQKQTLKKLGIPVADFIQVSNDEDIKSFANDLNYPVILKSRTMGYDGKGNYKIDSENEINNAVSLLSSRGRLLCEEFVDFDKEIAVQVVRNPDGEVKIYPVVETVQKDHICNLVLAEEDMFKHISGKVHKIASSIVNHLDYTGVMGIEMFLKKEGEIIVNELAPRVHNSGHYSIEGCFTSQFENHVRSILNLPLGSTELCCRAAVMINILGKNNNSNLVMELEKALGYNRTYIHLYGKRENRIGRKMGHITVLGEDINEALRIAKESRKCLNI
jgi:5-(carboxyamino)imidazole ribonucleotide synthase